MYLFVWILLFFLQHIVSEVELGTKKIERYKSSYVDFFKYAMKNVSINKFLRSLKLIITCATTCTVKFQARQCGIDFVARRSTALEAKSHFPLVPTPKWVLTYRYDLKSHSDNENKLANNLVLAHRSSLEHLKLSCVPITQLKFEIIKVLFFNGLIWFHGAF